MTTTSPTPSTTPPLNNLPNDLPNDLPNKTSLTRSSSSRLFAGASLRLSLITAISIFTQLVLSPAFAASSSEGERTAPKSSQRSTVKSTEEAWKPSPHGQIGDVGALVGAGGYGAIGAFTFLVTGDVTILPQGFLSDFTNQVDLGLEVGPVTFGAGTATMLNAYLKWDFLYSSQWTFYGLGGVGSLFLPSGLGSGSAIYPHLALGTMYYLLPQLAIRAEISHAFTGAGAVFSF